MAETLTLEGVCARHVLEIAERDGMHPACRCGIAFDRDGDHDAHLADAVRAWLLGQRDEIAEALRFKLVAYTLPANYWRPIGEQTHADVAKRCAPMNADALLAALTKADQ